MELDDRARVFIRAGPIRFGERISSKSEFP